MTTRVLLASTSPRRRQLLEQCDLEVLVCAPGVPEPPIDGREAATAVMRLAHAKAHAAPPTAEAGRLGLSIVAADTTVVLDGVALEKPDNDAHAAHMLRALAGRTHMVFTGFCVRGALGERLVAVSTAVSFRPLTDAEIARYLATGEHRDKAGAYGVQGGAGAFIDRIDGSYTNIVGLPLHEVLTALREVAA